MADALSESNFQITAGPGGSSASDCTGPLPFTPTMTAGATTDQAGGYTDFTMLLSRNDGQQHIEKLQFKTPEGLLGMIAKVPLLSRTTSRTRNLLCRFADRAHGRRGRTRPIPVRVARARCATGPDLPDRTV